MSLKKKVVWLPYDFDTAIGINNDGQLVFDYQLEDIDYQKSGDPIFNGQESVIWKNIRAVFGDELKTMYQNLRASGALSYEKIE
jgi:catabolite regulation protein CreA